MCYKKMPDDLYNITKPKTYIEHFEKSDRRLINSLRADSISGYPLMNIVRSLTSKFLFLVFFKFTFIMESFFVKYYGSDNLQTEKCVFLESFTRKLLKYLSINESKKASP